MKPTAEYLRERLTKTVALDVAGEQLEFVVRRMDSGDMFMAVGHLVLLEDGEARKRRAPSKQAPAETLARMNAIIAAAVVDPKLSEDDVRLIPLEARAALLDAVREFSGLNRPFDGGGTPETSSSSTESASGTESAPANS